MTNPSLERRVARLENDRDALYELISDFRAETRAAFAQHDARFDRIDGRLDEHDARFDRIDGRLDRIEGTLTEVLRRLPEPR